MNKEILESKMKKNYVVLIEKESYLNCGNRKFKYNGFRKKDEDVYFENYEDGKNFIDNYNLELKKDYHLDIDYLTLYKFDYENNKIINGILYDRTIEYDEITENLGYELKVIL